MIITVHVTMDSFGGAEICDLTGLYLLSKISILIDSDNDGLYRDDGLAAIHNANSPNIDRLRKYVIATFKNEMLSITTETKLIEK